MSVREVRCNLLFIIDGSVAELKPRLSFESVSEAFQQELRFDGRGHFIGGSR